MNTVISEAIIEQKQAEKKVCPYMLANSNEDFDVYCEGVRCMAWVVINSDKETGYCHKIFGRND